MSVKKILGNICQADKDFNLIEDNDVIAVGVSGGKDSVLLLYTLNLYAKWCAKRNIKNFKVIGIHLDMNFGGMDMSPIENFCSKNDIAYYSEKTKIYDILKLHLTNSGKISCSLCSTLKKGAMVKASKQLNATKVAFAHHGDDAVETLFLNMIHGGRIATFEPKMYLENQQIMFIRPLILCKEKDVISACASANIPIVTSTCPNDKHTQREDIKQLIHSIEQQFPSAQYNLLKSLSNDDKVCIWHPQKK